MDENEEFRADGIPVTPEENAADTPRAEENGAPDAERTDGYSTETTEKEAPEEIFEEITEEIPEKADAVSEEIAEEACAPVSGPAGDPVPETPLKGVYYEWDGAKMVKAKKKKGLKVFAACMCVAFVAVCAALALVILGGKSNVPPADRTEQTSQTNDTESKAVHSGKDKDKDKDKSKAETSRQSGKESSSEERGFPGSSSVVIRPSGGATYDMAELYEKCSPSCCTIYVPVAGGAYLGSGFVVDAENGYIVTNQHVIEGMSGTIICKFYDGREYDAVLVGSDELTDIAVLKIDAEGLTELPLGDSDSLRVGDPVIAIGTPYSEDLAGTLTNGMISGVDRKFEVKDYFGRTEKIMKLIQTNAAINNGNSGGPLINMQGQVVGINVMKLVAEYEGLGFAIPMSSAVTIINNLIDHGRVVDRTDLATAPAKLGITASQLSPNDENLRAEYDLPEDLPEGVMVISTTRSTAVYKAGLRNFDIITEFNGKPIASFSDLKSALAECSVGDDATLKVYRFETDEYLELEFTLEG